MTGRTYEDTLAVRMVDVIDDLPLPAGPVRLRPRRVFTARLDLAPVAMLLAVALVITLATPLGRDAISQAGSALQRLITPRGWVLYFNDKTAQTPDGVAADRLMFAAGAFPGVPSSPEVVRRNNVIGGWSPDGEVLGVLSGPRVLVADRVGNVREVADLATYGPDELEMTAATAISWTGRRELSIARWSLEGMSAVYRVNVADRTVARVPVRGAARSLSFNGRVQFSPDGRWLSWEQDPVACRGGVALHEIGTDRVLTLTDGQAERLSIAGWLRDGRMVTTVCDAAARETRLFIGRPDGPRGAPVATLRRGALDTYGIVDRARDRVMVLTEAAGRVALLTVHADGRVEQLAELPPLPEATEVAPSGVSFDGRSFAFQSFIRGKTPVSLRVGIIDLGTGGVVWACDGACGSFGGIR